MSKRLIIVLVTVILAVALVVITILLNPFKSEDVDTEASSTSSIRLDGATGSVFPNDQVESDWNDYLESIEQNGGLDIEVVPDSSTPAELDTSSTASTSSTTSDTATSSTTTSATTSTTTSIETSSDATSNTSTNSTSSTEDEGFIEGPPW